MRISDWSSDVCSSDLLCWPDSRSSSPYDPTRCGKVAEERSGSLRMTNGEASGGGKGLSLQWQMLIGFLTGLVLGLIAYVGAPGTPWVQTIISYVTGPIGQIFLRLLFMLVLPLLFSALVLGIAEMGEIRSLRRVGVRTLVYHPFVLLVRALCGERGGWYVLIL